MYILNQVKNYFKYFLTLLFCIYFCELSANQTLEFEFWKGDLKKEVLNKGISLETFDKSFKNIKPIKRVIELDRNQPEFKMTFSEYMSKVVTKTRISKAKQKLKNNKRILDQVEKKFGVQKRFIVALWGIETNFGQHLGSFSVIASLSTLAFDGRRSKYFRKELINALKIIDSGHILPNKMKGSWAGAMGQCQFMPSSFINYAFDWNMDGKKDIWSTKEDVFASIANYLSSVGWRNDTTWGREVIIPKNSNINFNSLSKNKVYKRMNEWNEIGIKTLSGKDLPKRNLLSRLILPKKSNERAFLAYNNFENILDWNRSNYFALAVGKLSDSLIDY